MQDNFDKEEFEKEGITNKEKLNNVLAFIPFINVFMLFVEKPGETEFSKKVNRQGIAIFLLYIVLFILCSFIGLGFLVTIAYIVAIIFFGAKAYNGIYVEIDFLEKLIKKFNK